MQRILLAGLGNPYRRDDGVGPAVAAAAARATGLPSEGPLDDPLALLGRWDAAELAVIVDAVRGRGRGGNVSVIECRSGEEEEPGSGGHSASTHGLSLWRVLELARTVGCAPQRVVAVGIEGEDFSYGTTFTRAVSAALPVAVSVVVAIVKGAGACV